MPSKQLTWFVTGTSSGFGEAFVKKILARGDKVIATARSLNKISHLAQAGASTLQLDVTASQSVIDAKAKEALAVYGGIDVLVNNAGSGILGTLEDLSAEQWLQQYNTNVFGVINVTKAFMPHLREKREGVIVFIGSAGGWNGAAGGGAYCSSKFALEGITESFALETEHFGIKTMTVQPGWFRTSLINQQAQEITPTRFSEYESVTKSLSDALESYNGKQPGDPEKAVDRILDVVRQEGVAAGRGIPLKLALGPDAVDGLRKKCETTLDMLRQWADVSSSTNFE